MTNEKLKEALKNEVALPHEIMNSKHPSVDDHKPEFVDYTKDGEFILKYPIRHEQCNGFHLLQGGTLNAFFDDNFGLFVYVAGEGGSFSTVNMTVNFHKSGVEDDKYVIISSRVISAGKRIVSMSAEARTTSGKLLATCQTNMINADSVFLSI